MIQNYSLAFIRAQLLINPSIEEVVAELKVTLFDLKEYLARFNYTVETLKKLELKDREALGTRFIKPRYADRDTRESYSLKQIHALILTDFCEEKTAEALGILSYSVTNRLLRFNYNDQPLTFKQLQELTIEDAQKEWGERYSESLGKNVNHLSTFTFAMVHSHIRKSEFATHAADSLGAELKTLRIFLTRANLNYTFLKKTEEIELIDQFKDAFDKPIPLYPVDVSEITLSTIHDEALSHLKLHATANSLGLHVDSLKKLLVRFSYKDAPLTFKNLIKLKVSEAEEIWKDDYNNPINNLPNPRKRKRSESNDDYQQKAPPLPTPALDDYSAGSSNFFKTPVIEKTVIEDNTLSLLFANYAKAYHS